MARAFPGHQGGHRRCDHQGRGGADAIRDWWTEAKRKTPHGNAPIDATTGDITRIRARVSGEFPGSPVTLLFTFTVRTTRPRVIA